VAAPDQTELVSRLQGSGWAVAYHDEDGTLLTRS
jgi:hypothetical protein